MKPTLFCRTQLHILAILFLLGASSAEAQVYFEETFLPVYILKNTAKYPNLGGSENSSVPTESGTGFDLRTTLGYVWWGQMVTGLTYNYYSSHVSRSATPSYESKDDTDSKKELGLTLGYLTGGWRFLFTYFLDSSRTYDASARTSAGVVATDTNETRTKGTGFQVTVGYSLALSADFQIGPSLVYRNVSYARGSRTNNVDTADSFADKDLTTAAIDAGLSPMISVIGHF